MYDQKVLLMTLCIVDYIISYLAILSSFLYYVYVNERITPFSEYECSSGPLLKFAPPWGR